MKSQKNYFSYVTVVLVAISFLPEISKATSCQDLNNDIYQASVAACAWNSCAHGPNYCADVYIATSPWQPGLFVWGHYFSCTTGEPITSGIGAFGSLYDCGSRK